ncbi:GNAT family N-acetyltransferase [Sediminibacillus albus]|uniref:ElaA protein n=1 Tax=Sediminibacillus albus TaxID=407036 RepID=A0A1G9ASF3_9BACI|nr:GNAT family N-acetyltransferase [Sediminibacillus albus]SDK30197.1 ElaA protein [Sediminibacillus albus]
MSWKLKTFKQLNPEELYAIIQTRIDVFVVEQNCPYRELDGHDKQAVHLLYAENGTIIAYARLLPRETVYPQASIGRVLVHGQHRKKGFAKALLGKSIEYIATEWKEKEIKIQAQAYLRNFYSSFGFKAISGIYLDDGIPHIDMQLVLK